jgi:hypothetical protein
VAEWSLDHGFEAVEAVAIQPLAGSAGRDKAGVARVYESLQSTMWSTMRRKPVGGGAGGVLRLATLEAELQEEGAAAAGAPSQYEAPSVPGISGERESDSLQGMLSSMRLAAEVGRGDAAPAAAGAGAAEPSMGQEEEEDELDLGSLMSQMQAVRAAAVKGGMGDDERRERAAAMALRLLQLMGDGGPGDES